LSAAAFVQSELTKICQAKSNTQFAPDNQLGPSQERTLQVTDNQSSKNNLFGFLEKKTSILDKDVLPAAGMILMRQYLESPNISLSDDPLQCGGDMEVSYCKVGKISL
jgi:hypothetical protein